MSEQRRFGFGDRVRLKKGPTNIQYICTDFTPDGANGGMLISCHGEDGSWIRVHSSQLEPTVAGHLSAGEDYRDVEIADLKDRVNDIDAMCDSSYLCGLKTGWKLCQDNDTNTFQSKCEELKILLRPESKHVKRLVACADFMDKMRSAITSYALAIGDSPHSGEDCLNKWDAIDALLSEVVELPEPKPPGEHGLNAWPTDEDRVCNIAMHAYGTTYHIDRGDALKLAAALIRAAREQMKTPGAE